MDYKPKRMFIIFLRLIGFGITLVATIIMGTSHEKGSFFALSYEAKFSDTPSFKYFVIVNAIASVYSFGVLFIPEDTFLWRFIAAFDLVFTLLLTSSISAAMAIGEVGKKGNVYAGWLPICDQVTKYCHQVTLALTIGFIGVLFYLFLFLCSLHYVLTPFLVHKH